MSNPNMEPMPFRRNFGGSGSAEAVPAGRSLSQLAQTSEFPSGNEDAFVDASGLAIIKPVVTGACRKCGYPGHLPFQCRNFIQLEPNKKPMIDISSTSSESENDETPLIKRQRKLERKEERRKRKQAKKERKKERKREKKEKKRAKKLKKRRDSSSDDDSSDSDDDRRKKRKERKRKNSTSSDDSNDSERSRKRRRKDSESSDSSRDRSRDRHHKEKKSRRRRSFSR